jgi:signal transduction histidine kinase
LVAFLLALVFIGLLSRNITRPIRLLAQTADRVYRGDLSARVEWPGAVERQASNQALVTDDLMVLVETMNSMIEKLEHQERGRRDFISSVSHDLRTPLTSIRGFVEGILDGTVPEEKIGTYLEIVKQEVLRLQTLVNTLSETSLYESGSVRLDETVFDINTVIKEDVYGLESLLNEKNIGVQTDFDETEQGRLLAVGDREAINRVVYNIISNAIRFSPQEGVIALTTRRAPRSHQLEIIIEDSGPGIPVSDWPYIFDRFYKVDKSRTAKGSGLGLFICRTILAAHGQRIAVGDSDLGGAKFSFTLSAP